VINKQAPNKQIWWSSPTSGPQRYLYNNTGQRWENNRGDALPDLHQLLEKELGALGFVVKLR
jgi:frataxin